MKNKKFFKLLILFLVILLPFVALEIATRLIFESKTVLNINIGGMKKYHPTRRTQLKRNYRAKNISINSFGILGPEFKLQPDPHGIRILTIGDSVTFNPPQRNYPIVLEEKLQEFFPHRDIEVINGAVPGYSTYEALDWYHDFLFKLKPDIAIIYLGWNDIGQYQPFGLRYKNENKSYRERSLIGILMEHFYLLRVPYFFIGRIEKSKPIDLSPLTTKEKEILGGFHPIHYENNLKSLIGELKKQNVDVYLVSLAGLVTYHPTAKELKKMLHFPRGMREKLEIYKGVYSKYNKTLEKISRSSHAPLIDLRKIILNPSQRGIFTDTCHINVRGAERYGAFIAETIREKVGEILVRKTRTY